MNEVMIIEEKKSRNNGSNLAPSKGIGDKIAAELIH